MTADYSPTDFSPAAFGQNLENLQNEIAEIKTMLSQKMEYADNLTERRFRDAGEIVQTIGGEGSRNRRGGAGFGDAVSGRY